MKEKIEKIIEIPEGIDVKIDGKIVVKGPKGDIERKFSYPGINLEVSEKKILIFSEKCTQREKKIIMTTAAHITNMINGVQEKFKYKLQVCSVHFPITVKIDGNFLKVKNFFGETKERKALILPGVKAEIKGDIIEVESVDREKAGQTAANIETATKVRSKDRRIFQDGIYIIEKG